MATLRVAALSRDSVPASWWSAVTLSARVLRDRRARFVLAGGLNTAFGLMCFMFFQHAVGQHWGYMWSLGLTHVTSVLFAFCTHRWFVFQVSGGVLRDLWRFESVYLTSLAINAVLLPAAVELAHLPVLGAQTLIIINGVALSWLGHSRFSFRRDEASTDGLSSNAGWRVPA